MNNTLLINLKPIASLQGQTITGKSSFALGVLGESGSGKSTLLKTLAGLVGDANDQFELFGYAWRHADRNNPCVYVNQTLGLFNHWTVAKNLEKTAKHCNHNFTDKGYICSINDLVSDLKLEPLLNKPIEMLSGGETQRVLIARAMLSGKPILLLDEVLSGLDSTMRTYVMTVLQKWHKQYHRRYVVVSHNLEDVSFLCNEALLVNKGAISYSSCLHHALSQYEAGPENYMSDIQVAHQETLCDEGVSSYRLKQSNQFIYRRINQNDIVQANDVTHVVVAASNVSVSVDTNINISTLNKLIGTLVSITEFDNHALIDIDIDGQIIQSLISKKSLKDMKLTKNQSVAALFKAI